MPNDQLNFLVHKLLHAAATVMLGRQHVFYLLRALNAETRLDGGSRFIGRLVRDKLEWLPARLTAPEPDVCPLAARAVFPTIEEVGVIFS